MASFNTTEYAWAQMSATMLGLTPDNIIEAKYESKRKVTNNYGRGSKPVSRSYGNYEYTASITLYMSEVERLQAASPTGDLQDIPPFDINILFLPTSDGNSQFVKHVIKNCSFTNNKREMKQDDEKGLVVELELLPADIIWK